MRNDKKILRQLKPFTEIVLFVNGEHAWLTKQQVSQKIGQVMATLAVAKAMTNDEPSPATNDERGDSNGQAELPWTTPPTRAE